MRVLIALMLFGLLGADSARAQEDEDEVVVQEKRIIDVERRYSSPVPDFAPPPRSCEQTTVERIERDGTRIVNREEVCY
jgi:hypothetical protein